MNDISLAIALIRKIEPETTRWLAIWNQPQDFWDFVVGEALESEQARDALRREVAWVLDLSRRRDFLISNTAQLHVQFQDRLPGTDRDLVVELAFYPVDVYRRQAWKELVTRGNLRWFSAPEICAGQATDGSLLNPLISGWINRWQIIQPWQP